MSSHPFRRDACDSRMRLVSRYCRNMTLSCWHGYPSRIPFAQLERMSGRSHRLLTAVAVHDTRSGETRVDLDVHILTMRSLTRVQLEAYVRADRPLGCAGAYMLERRGIALFESIVADPALADDTAIIGLPMMRTLRLLRGFGMEVLEAPLTAR